MRFGALLLLTLPMPVQASIAIAPGGMLGSGYDRNSFYIRHSDTGAWQKTYTGPQYKPAAAGKLMNLRIAQAVVHDEWLTEEKFDPNRNTDRVIAALDTYQKHGILSVSVSLQGANPAYERTANIKRDRPYKLGPGKGMLQSAFRPDGSLKPEWMARTLRLARELDRRNMVLNLVYFYAYQDELFESTAAIDAAVRNATDWLIDNKVRNVLIEIANEYDGNSWDHDRYVYTNMGKLLGLARSRFEVKRAGYRLPISVSSIGGRGMQVTEDMQQHADYITLHGNHNTPAAKGARTKELLAAKSTPGPVVFNEDDNGRDATPEIRKLELDSCDAIFEAGGSWGYMPWKMAQIWPFRFYDPFTATGPEAEYFQTVLKHIRSLVEKQ